jgi:serine/threonine protein kinase
MTESVVLQPNQCFSGGRYTLLKLLGRCGMGVAWLAQDERLHEPVALKFLPPEVAADPASLNDLRRESALSHDLFYALRTCPAAEAFENAIYAPRDAKPWQCRATFTTASFCRSTVEANGNFSVSIDCRGFTSKVVPNSTGHILRVVPKPVGA